MGTFYTDLRDGVADALLTEFGTAFVLQEEVGETYNEMTGFIDTPGSLTNHAVTGLFSDFKQDEIDGSNVLRSDFKVILSAVDPVTELPIAVPNTNMKFLDGVVEYKIIDVRPLRPGGVDVIYTLQVRK